MMAVDSGLFGRIAQFVPYEGEKLVGFESGEMMVCPCAVTGAGGTQEEDRGIGANFPKGPCHGVTFVLSAKMGGDDQPRQTI